MSDTLICVVRNWPLYHLQAWHKINFISLANVQIPYMPLGFLLCAVEAQGSSVAHALSWWLGKFALAHLWISGHQGVCPGNSFNEAIREHGVCSSAMDSMWWNGTITIKQWILCNNSCGNGFYVSRLDHKIYNIAMASCERIVIVIYSLHSNPWGNVFMSTIWNHKT